MIQGLFTAETTTRGYDHLFNFKILLKGESPTLSFTLPYPNVKPIFVMFWKRSIPMESGLFLKKMQKASSVILVMNTFETWITYKNIVNSNTVK